MAQETLPERQPGGMRPDPVADRPGRRARLRGGGRAGWGRVAAAVAAGLIMWPALPPLDAWPLAPAGVAVFTLALRGLPARTAAWLGFWCGAAFFLPALSGIVKIGPDGWIILSLVQALYLAPMAAGVAVVTRLPGWPLWTAALWVAQELVRGRVPFGGFPWARLAFAQTDTPLTPYAAVGGAPLVTFLTALIGALLALAALHAVPALARPARLPRLPGRTSPAASVASAASVDAAASADAADSVDAVDAAGGRTPLRDLRDLRDLRESPGPREPAAAAVRWRRPALALAGVAAIGLAGLAVPVPSKGRPVTAAVIQGNVPRLGMDYLGQREAVLNNHVRRTHEMAAKVRAGTLPRPQLVVWPENSSDIDPYTDPDARRRIDGAVRDIGVPVLVGVLVDTPDGSKVENRGIVWDPRTGPGDHYVKRHPVPFGEYLPFRDVLTKMITRFERIPRDFAQGRRPGLLRLGPARVGDVICFEVAYDGVVRDVASADMLVVQTNNATYGHTSLPPQQIAMSRLRAVEHGRTVLVAATSGISAIVAPDGRMIDRSREFTPDIQVATVPARTSRTLADRLGALPEWALTVLALGAVAAAVRLTSRKSEGD